MSKERQGRMGRPKGSHNKATLEQIEKIKESGQTPLEYLASIYQDPARDIKDRIDAAKAASPYVHSRLSSMEVNAAVTEVSHEEWIRMLS